MHYLTKTQYLYHILIILSRRSNNSTVWVISAGNITFTEINALTSAKENATLLNSSNYTTYTVKKDGTGATGTWGINISGNAATTTKLQTARTITINGSSKTFDGSGNISWSLAELNLPSNDHNHDDRYVKKSGDTMTGPLVINSSVNNSYNEGLRITRAANNWAGITFGSTGVSGAPTDGWFAATNPAKEFIISPDTSANTTGLTLIKGGDLKWRNNKVWHEGNDGTGSGLDADKLDGFEATGLFQEFKNAFFFI